MPLDFVFFFSGRDWVPVLSIQHRIDWNHSNPFNVLKNVLLKFCTANSSNYTNLILPKRFVLFSLSWPSLFLGKSVENFRNFRRCHHCVFFGVGSSADASDRVSGADRGCRELLRSHAGLYRCARLSPNSIGLNGHSCSWHSGTTSCCSRSGGDWWKNQLLNGCSNRGGGKGWFVVWSFLSEMVDVFFPYNWGVLRLSEKWSI